MKPALWKKGRSTLGALDPLLGSWTAAAEMKTGATTVMKVRCSRTFAPVLGGKYIQLQARWEFEKERYDELAIFGAARGGIVFWSFTSDGKRSQGRTTNGKDVHAEAIAFAAKMPAGLARMIYWPDEEGGFHWAVEARTKKGWKRFTEHHYRPL